MDDPDPRKLAANASHYAVQFDAIVAGKIGKNYDFHRRIRRPGRLRRIILKGNRAARGRCEEALGRVVVSKFFDLLRATGGELSQKGIDGHPSLPGLHRDDLGAHRFTLKDDSLRLNKLLVTAGGSITTGSPNMDLDLKFAAPSTAFAEILSLVPAIYAKDFAKRVAEAASIVDFFLAVLHEGETDQHRLVIAAEKIVLPLVAAVQSPLERDHFVNAAARSLGLTAEAVRASVPRAARELAAARADAPSAARPAAPERLSPRAQRELMLRAAHAAYPGTPLAERIESSYARIVGSALSEGEVPERALFEVGLTFGEAPAENAADELLQHFEKAVLAEALLEATTRLRRAESAKDQEGIREASNACADLSRRMTAL